MALKRPDMTNSSRKVKCCEGPNKGKMFDPGDACENELDIFVPSDCECVECTDDDPNATTSLSCQARGYNSCYVCKNGKCVKGPQCCSNQNGRNVIHDFTRKGNQGGCGVYTMNQEDTGALPGAPYEPPEPNEDECCAFEYKAVLLNRPAYKHGYRNYYFSLWGSRNDCETRDDEPEQIWFLLVDCETLYIQETVKVGRIWNNNKYSDSDRCGRQCTANGMPNSCTRFTYTEYQAFAVGPNGTRALTSKRFKQTRPGITGYFGPIGVNSQLAAEYGDSNFYRGFEPPFVGYRYVPIWRDKEFKVRNVFVGSSTSKWAPDAGPMQVSEHPVCAPYQDRLTYCYCSSTQFDRINDPRYDQGALCQLCRPADPNTPWPPPQ